MSEPVTNKKARVTWAAVKRNAGYAYMGLSNDGKLIKSDEMSVYMWMN